MAGYVKRLVLQHKAPKSFQGPKEQNLFRSRQSLQASLANCVGTGHPHAPNCREAISLSPSSHQDNTHFTGKNVFAVRFTLVILQFSQELEALAVCKLPGVYSTEGLLTDSHSPAAANSSYLPLMNRYIARESSTMLLTELCTVTVQHTHNPFFLSTNQWETCVTVLSAVLFRTKSHTITHHQEKQKTEQFILITRFLCSWLVL